jgi:ubiquinone/menaquinone biosynthesis C-methylase UbiE
MGYVFDFKDARAYERSIDKHRGRFYGTLEERLVLDMLKPSPGESILDIGCGTGVSLMAFLDQGLRATGLDPSPYMLDLAHERLQHRADLYRGMAENLPFSDNEFNHACLVITLEFVEQPYKALAEACRVAKDRVFVGFLNRQAIRGTRLRLEGMIAHTIYRHARLFSIWELRRMFHSLAGNVPITWRTVCQPPWGRAMTARIERYCLRHKNPFGAFAGMVVTLVPRYRTRPLAICYHPKQAHGPAPG